MRLCEREKRRSYVRVELRVVLRVAEILDDRDGDWFCCDQRAGENGEEGDDEQMEFHGYAWVAKTPSRRCHAFPSFAEDFVQIGDFQTRP